MLVILHLRLRHESGIIAVICPPCDGKPGDMAELELAARKVAGFQAAEYIFDESAITWQLLSHMIHHGVSKLLCY